ncbi:hypothetical protein WOLCODRAFT_115073 [Wolfiporia cocos MD-104 SS10]|uniref:Nucleolus and neural progenitor protein-like N-terminal domain-containing protein n=1 Tax=Wolfiporia cocos (strain MD-104) TaxID=742152 RepID=A0A2H3JHH4_WOLCO|nr:hypothetical protein WOLCODRAFT_115073 [Wolfiporia cocos MD-104 SS10]
MPAKRIAPVPPLSLTPRADLAATTYPEIDAVLKKLKSCTRNLQAALESHRLELQVLERLYYKSKNQHRTALFWQRVAETRRFGDRLQCMDLHAIVERLRLSFWGNAPSAKILKGPWTECPGAVSIDFVARRCLAGRDLINETQKRLLLAYNSFTQMMQSGAFLHFILTLVAIVSRLNRVVIEIDDILGSCSNACTRLLRTLSPQHAEKLRSLVHGADIMGSSIAALPIPVAQASSEKIDEILEEDTGDVLDRPLTLQTEEIQRTIREDDASPSLDLQLFPPSLDLDACSSVPSMPSAISVRETVARKNSSSKTTGQGQDTATGSSKRRSNDDSQHTKKSSKKKKRDEIDDIFGF